MATSFAQLLFTILKSFKELIKSTKVAIEKFTDKYFIK